MVMNYGEYAFDPPSVSTLNPSKDVYSFDDITPDWVIGISDNGQYPYGPMGRFLNGQSPLNVFSPIGDFQNAFPWIDMALLDGWDNGHLDLKFIYYKH